MHLDNQNIQLISAPSILGLKPTGVEDLANSLLASGLVELLRTRNKVITVETLNHKYNHTRDASTNVLNPNTIREFSFTLGKVVSDTVSKRRFPFVLGGDCSILIGIMSALKAIGDYGLIFMDAHADFYQPDKSITGEVADMDLAIITGRGPMVLTNINNLQPYVEDKNVIHIGQRDWEETRKYGSQDIRETSIKCFSLDEIEKRGIEATSTEVLKWMNKSDAGGYWIHFDTDVLSDEVNPAVDYRLPGGLQFEQIEFLLRQLLQSDRMAGISVTIFNPRLDASGHISNEITESLIRAFS